MDFDPKHEKFGTFEVDFEEITALFNYSSPNSIRTRHSKLIQLGLIAPTTKSKVFRVTNPERYLSQTGYRAESATTFYKREGNESVESILHSIGISSQHIEKIIQPIERTDIVFQANSGSKALGSSKVRSSSSTSKAYLYKELEAPETFRNSQLSETDKEFIDQIHS